MSDEARAVALDAALTRHDAVVHGGAGELRELVAIANVLRASAPMCAPSPVFRSASRARLRAAIAADPARRRRRPGAQPHRSLRSTLHGLMSSWLTRAAAGVATLSAVGVATASASAGALPSDALYPVKQAQEVFALQLAADDTARAGVLVQQADTRLDEAARLVETGRMHEAVEAAQRYDTARDRAATALEVAPSGDQLQRLDDHDARLEVLLSAIPAEAKGGLERALAAAERTHPRSAKVRVAPATDPTLVVPPSPPPAVQPSAAVPTADPARAVEPEAISVEGGRQDSGSLVRATPGARELSPPKPSEASPVPGRGGVPARKPDARPGRR